MTGLPRRTLAAALSLAIAGGAAVPLADASSAAWSPRGGHGVCARIIAIHHLPVTVLQRRGAHGAVLSRHTISVRAVVVRTHRRGDRRCVDGSR